MKVVLHTNVLVSGFLSLSGPPGEIVQLAISEQLTVCYDGRILTEYQGVLRRPGFDFVRPHEVEILLGQVARSGYFADAVSLAARLPHANDEKFLEVAIGAGAAHLVTGNLKHFPPDKRQGVHVVSPAEFVVLYRERN